MNIVTGGGTGIGRAIALALADRGDRVLVTGRRAEPLAEVAERSHGRIATRSCDMADVDQVGSLVDDLSQGEAITGLVLNAGGNPGAGQPDPADLAAEADLLDRTYTANLRSSAVTLRGLLPRLADDASVVLFSSIGAEYGSGYYGPVKAAVAAYSVGMAHELGPRGIRVNCLSPGYITDTEFFAGAMTDERAEQLRAATLLGRVGRPEDVVGVTLFLLSETSRHLTGQNLHLDGGAFTTR